MIPTTAHRHAEQLARDHLIAQEDADAERRSRRRKQWPAARADLMRRWVAAKRRLEDRGEPFVLSPPPGLECPRWFLDADESPRAIIEPPVIPAVGIGAPGHNALGRYVGPKVETRTAEEQFKDAEKKSWWKA